MRLENIKMKEWIKKSDIDKINGYFISNEQISRELELLSIKECNKLCVMVDEMLKGLIKYCEDKASKTVMKAELAAIGANYDISAATAWTVYLKWLDRECD